MKPSYEELEKKVEDLERILAEKENAREDMGIKKAVLDRLIRNVVQYGSRHNCVNLWTCDYSYNGENQITPFSQLISSSRIIDRVTGDD